MMHDRARLASLFTPDGVLRMPNIPVELVGREEIRAGGERLQSQWDFFVQTTDPGTIQLDGDTATGRAYIQELARARDGRQGLNYAIYHDRYQRTPDGWKFTERLYEVKHLDPSPLTGSAPRPAGAANPPAVPLRHDPTHSPARPRRQASKWPPQSSDIGLDTDSQPGDQRRIPSQINLICAAADPRSRRVSASRTAATCAPHHRQQSREVIALSASAQLGMAAPGQIQLTVVTLAGWIGPPDDSRL